jgi:2-oxoglutarate dehydrogenase E2 component (dihydrolipoamide succinyltransferase)
MARLRLVFVLAALLALPVAAAAQTPSLPPTPDLPPPSAPAPSNPAPSPAPSNPAPAPAAPSFTPEPEPVPEETGPSPEELEEQREAEAAERRREAAAARRRALARKRAAERARREREREEALAAAATAQDGISGALPEVTASAQQAVTAAAITETAQREVEQEGFALRLTALLILDAVFLIGIFEILRRRYRSYRAGPREIGPKRIPARARPGPAAGPSSDRLPAIVSGPGTQLAVTREAVARRRARAAVAVVACASSALLVYLIVNPSILGG